jgi:uncharacterized protein YjbI with pentapeptide repeats
MERMRWVLQHKAATAVVLGVIALIAADIWFRGAHAVAIVLGVIVLIVVMVAIIVYVGALVVGLLAGTVVEYRHKAAIAIVLGVIVLIVASFWFWGVLVGYVEPEGPTGRKDVVQAFALILAGVVGFIGGIVGIANFSVSRRNLRQQIELENQRRETTLDLENRRSQDAALQAYFEQMGDLLTDHNLIATERADVRQLARAQTLTVLARLSRAQAHSLGARVDQERKADLVSFLHGAGLIDRDKPIVPLREANLSNADLSGTELKASDLSYAYLNYANLSYADLREAHLSETDLREADLRKANLSGADLREANLYRADLREANLSGANLSGADLKRAKLREANLTEAIGLTDEQIVAGESFEDATMPNGQKYEDWLKSKGSGEDGKNSSPS